MKTWIVALLLVVVWLISALSPAQSPARGKSDEELRAHLEVLAQRLADESLDIGVRERLAAEMAGTLDRAAISAPTSELRRARWTEAVDVLDKFVARHPDVVQARAFQVQAAVYVWARARTGLQAFRTNPTDARAREQAAADLEECIKRLRSVKEAIGDATDVLAQNARFRLAQALADAAEVGPDDPSSRRLRYIEALDALVQPIKEPSLQGFSHLLRALLLARLGRFEESQAEQALAARSSPPPSESELVEAKLAVFLGRKDFASALKAVTEAKLSTGEKSALGARARLEERVSRPEGRERDAAEKALFVDLKDLRAASRPETVAALIAAASALKEPGPTQEPVAWDLLAEGAVALGDTARAGALALKGAERAEALGQSGESLRYRLRAGAYLFQAEKFVEADPLLARVASDPKAGSDRVKAGLLLALARGRALALGRPEASQAAYASALSDQIKNFPDDPTASEARWLLGKLRLADSDREGALALWEAIPHGSPRWLDSRVEIAAVRQHDLDNQRLNNDREAVTRRMADARDHLARCLEQAKGDVETNEILLASSRLELTPGLGNPEVVEKLWGRLQHSAALPTQRDAARRLHIAALARWSRWVEAESAARQEIRLSKSVDLFPLIRLLDRAAAEAESDLRTRRIGLLIRVVMTRVLEDPEALPPRLRGEAQLRNIRALLFSGDDAAARRAVARWSAPLGSENLDLLRELADTYTRLEAYEMAVDVQRLRAKLAPTGSLVWFDARYGLALAYYRSGKARDALHLIDATAILHPELGGGELREKFIRLRQRIDPTE